jgi:hypothetical protein
MPQPARQRELAKRLAHPGTAISWTLNPGASST